ncbi:hypothetical protein A2V71_00465 [Candidatus Berkelbacteria bacterium RBG_13_40_8]|uniref:PEGA domain-containing protein n=1 Tax=Candidatus Berkelbacteria bacterium RBG_13_40_8 TaxID=1797467 RepID=A0A1F5DQ53_9BACT|nr:MAG: hypothetical protein A2V71_00465 [Candidatus Berkelbacteria bacterium RBG_13_40_8]
MLGPKISNFIILHLVIALLFYYNCLKQSMTITKKRKIYFGIFWSLLVISFIFFAGLLVLVANGYHLNLSNFRLQKTGMIVLDGTPRSIILSVNGEERNANFPTRVTKLFPGRYELKITKDNYEPWEKVVEIKGGQAALHKNIILFLKEPEIQAVSKNEGEIANIQKDFQNQSKSITIKENEIWFQEQLLTRFSQNVFGAIVGSDGNHIFAQVGNEIRVIEIDGANDTGLFQVKNANPIPFGVSGNTVRFVEEGEVFEVIIK